MATKIPKPRLRPETQQKPNLRDPNTIPGPDQLGTGNTNVMPRRPPPPEVLGTGNTDVTPRLREDIPVPAQANLYGADALSSPPPEIVAAEAAATPVAPPDIIKDQALADAKKPNPDVQFAPGTTGDMIFRTSTRANERTIEADKQSGFAARPDFKMQLAKLDAADAMRAKLERLNGTRSDSWMYDAHIASKVQGGSDAPPTVGPDGTYDDFLKNRYAGITNDQALDGLMRPHFDELAKVNPLAAANGTNIGDTWRTVQALGNAPQQPATSSPKAPSDPLMDAGQAAHDAVFGALGSAGDAANELLGIKSAKGQTAAPAQPAMTPEQAMQYLTNSNKAAPPSTKGPLDVMLEVAGNTAAAAGANTVDAVAQIAPGAYSAVKAALDGIDGVTSAVAGFAGDKADIQVLKDFAKGGLGIPEADSVFGPAGTPIGQVSRGISQFLVGYVTGGRVLEGMGWAAGAGGATVQGVRTLTQGAVADAAFFDGQSGNLSNLVDQFPALRNPVTDYLKSNPEDTEAEGRFKNALNGILAAPLVPAMVGVVRSIKYGARLVSALPPGANGKLAATGGNPLTAPAAAAAPKSLLGDVAPDAPVTINHAAAKVATAQDEVIGGKPPSPSAVVDASKLTAAESGAVGAYTYKDSTTVNNFLLGRPYTSRLATPASISAGIANLDSAIGKRPLAADATLYWGAPNDVTTELAALQPGETWTTTAYMSTSSSRSEGEGFRRATAPGVTNKLVVIEAAKGASVLDTQPYSMMPHQMEFLVARGSTFEKVSETPDAITMRLVKNGVAPQPSASAPRNEASIATPTTAPSIAAPPPGYTAIGSADGPQVFANFAAIKTPDDLQKIANDMVAAYEGTTDAARQGIVTNAQTKAAAGSIDAFDTLLSRKTGDAPNAAQVYAWKSLYIGSLSKLQEVAKAASTASLTDAPAALLQMREMESVVLAVQKEFYGARAESGRALQAFKIPPDSVFAAKQVQNLLNAYGGIDANVDLARKLAAIDDPKALADFVESTVFTKSKDAWQQYYYASILSSPKTHIRNFVGNTVMMGMNLVETGLASQFSAAMGSDAVKGGEAIANWYGIKAAFGDALQAASRTWKTGESTGGYGLNKVDFPQRNAISATTWNLAPTSTFGRAVDVLGAVTQVPSRLLSTSDEFFKTVGASGTGYQMAFRQAQSEVAKGTLQPDQVASRVTQLVSDFPNRLDDATKAAVADKAAYLTFTTPPKQGGWVDLLLKIRAVGDQPDASLISKAGGLAARTIIPFVNTPANIMLATFERTPLAPLTARYRDAMAEGGAAAYTANAKMALGTMSMATWTDMAMNGQVTGQGPPSNTAEYQALYATGWRPYSVKMGDHYVSYQGLEPLSTVLGWSATIGEMMSNADTTSDPTAQANIEKAVAATVFALGDVVLSKTYLSSSADLLDAINSGDPSAAEYFIKKYGAGMLVPNIVKDANTIVDPAQKYTTSILDEAKARIPGLSGDLPPRRDAFGFVKSYQSGFGSAYDAISPFFASQVKDLPVASAMLKDGWAISTPSMAFSIDGQRVDVSNQPVIYSRFLELRGQVKPSDLPDKVTKNYAGQDVYSSGEAAQTWSQRLQDRYGDRSMTDTLNGIVSEAPPPGLRDFATRYHSFTNADDRRKFILNIVSDYQDAAKAVLFSEYPQLPARAAKLKAAGQEAQP